MTVQIGRHFIFLWWLLVCAHQQIATQCNSVSPEKIQKWNPIGANLQFYKYTYGTFLKMGYPKMGGFWWKIPKKKGWFGKFGGLPPFQESSIRYSDRLPSRLRTASFSSAWGGCGSACCAWRGRWIGDKAPVRLVGSVVYDWILHV